MSDIKLENEGQEIFTQVEFVKSPFFLKLSEDAQFLIEQLIYRLFDNDVKFLIKTRNDNTFTFACEENPSRNIVSILPYKRHFVIKILNQFKKSCYSNEDISDDLINEIKEKYKSLYESKIQTSIYFHEGMLEKLRDKAKNEKKKLNELVVEAVEKYINNTIFINKAHEYNYLKLVEEAEIYEQNYEKKALFYVLSSSEIYLRYVKFDFENKKLEVSEEIYNCEEFTTCSEYLLASIMDIYNGKGLRKLEYLCEFGCMEETNIALNALKINYGLIKIPGGKRARFIAPLEF